MDNCAGCVFADLVENRTSVKMINNHIIKMRCNNVNYQNPTIHFPPEVCRHLDISDDCHPNYQSGGMLDNRTKTETVGQN